MRIACASQPSIIRQAPSAGRNPRLAAIRFLMKRELPGRILSRFTPKIGSSVRPSAPMEDVSRLSLSWRVGRTTISEHWRCWTPKPGEFFPIASRPPKDYRAARENFARPAWDASGTKLIYRSFDDQAQPVAISLWDAGTGESRVLLTGSEGFATALIGGDGRIVWAVTNTSRLLRLDLVRGLTDEILPPLGAGASGADGVGVPGSAILIRGTGFTKTQMALDGDVQLPLVDVAPEGLWVQIPWEYSSLSQAIHKVLIRSQNNPFEGLVSVTVTPRIAPHIATWAGQATGFEYAKAVHADFQSLVSPSSPARPGETVHVYLPGSARSGSSDWRPGSIDASGPSCHAAHVQVGKRRVAAAPNALPGLHGWFDWNLPSRPGHPRQRSSRTPAALLQRA